MARTPLLRSLKRLLSDHFTARAQGMSVEHLHEVRAAAREERAAEGGPGAVSRRRFLVGAAAGAAALSLPRTLRAESNPTVAIVGGGIAGLTCAVELADRHIPATVYEASGRVGGRMFSNTSYWNQGQVSEWCGELIDTNHFTVRKLAQRFGLPIDNLLDAQPPGSEDTYLFSGSYYPVAAAELDFDGVSAALSNDLHAASYPTTFDAFTSGGQMLDRMSIYDWIETRVPGGHGSPFGKLLDVAYTIEYGADTQDQAALNLIYLLGYQANANSFAAFGVSDERYHIRGGNQALPQVMAESLGIGTTVKLGHRLLRLGQTSAGRYSLTFQNGSATTEVVADYVVLALPFAVLRDIDYDGAGFDPLKDQAIQELGRGHNGKLQLQFSTRPWSTSGPWPGISNGSTYADTGYQASWEASRAQAGSNGLLVLYSGGSTVDGMSTSSAFATAPSGGVNVDAQNGLTQLATVFPGISAKWNGKATQSLPHKSSFFNASYSYYRVGQYTDFGGYERVRQGGVLFCGEHTSTNFQGFMEGGAHEGKRAATELARLL